jgi:hypothetical protein
MTLITAKVVDRFIDLVLKELKGEWVIVGGVVPYLLGSSERPTLDIDIAGPDEASQADTLKLMDIAETLGLPVESINQAASFFLKRIPDWQKQLVLIRSNQHCKVFRPSIELYFALKLQRGSESDIADLMSAWKLETDKEKFRVIVKNLCHSHIVGIETPLKTRVEKLLLFVEAN